MAQVENEYNTREVVVKHGSLPGAVEQAVVQVVLSPHPTHATLVNLATSVLKPGRQVMPVLTEVIYDFIRNRRNIDLDNEAI
jgi:type I restriction enzyme, R subunit